MDLQDYFGVVARVIKNGSTFSQAKDAWAISVPHLNTILQQKQVNLPPELPSIEDVLEEGVCRGLWEMDYDTELGTDIVVFR